MFTSVIKKLSIIKDENGLMSDFFLSLAIYLVIVLIILGIVVSEAAIWSVTEELSVEGRIALQLVVAIVILLIFSWITWAWKELRR